MKPVLAIDMDCILVDMLTAWIKKYNEDSGDSIKLSDIKEYEMHKFCDSTILYKVLERPSFFFNMEPMPGAVKAFNELMPLCDLIVVTQPPRSSYYAIRDKTRWMRKHLPTFFQKNMIFCHRKELIRADVLFDDKPEHLINWKKLNPGGLTATLDWPYNKFVKTDFRGTRKNGWRNFVKWITKTFK